MRLCKYFYGSVNFCLGKSSTNTPAQPRCNPNGAPYPRAQFYPVHTAVRRPDLSDATWGKLTTLCDMSDNCEGPAYTREMGESKFKMCKLTRSFWNTCTYLLTNRFSQTSTMTTNSGTPLSKPRSRALLPQLVARSTISRWDPMAPGHWAGWKTVSDTIHSCQRTL